MKKVLSLLLSSVMLLSVFSLSSVCYAAATTNREAADELVLGQTLNVNVIATSDDDDTEYFYAQFAPKATGWYEFFTDTKFKSKATEDTEKPTFRVTVTDKDENLISNVMARDLSKYKSAEAKEISEEYGYSADLIYFTAEMKAGNTYYFKMSNNGGSNFKTGFVAIKHVHQEYTKRFKSIVENDGTSDGGGVYKKCKVSYCDLREPVEEYPDITSVTLSPKKYVYDGKEKKPEVIVKTNEGNLPAKYYSVTYRNNKNIGKATVTIVFKDRYEGTVTRNFKILPKGTKIKKVTAGKKSAKVTWKKKGGVSGYQIQAATDEKFSKNAKLFTAYGSKTASQKLTGLKKGKKYFFRIRTYKTVGKKKFYSNWSSPLSKRIK